MSLKIALRYAVLISLLMLLWLSLEYMVGLHDRLAAFHPYVTLLSLAIPVYCLRKALNDLQDEEPRPLTFRQALVTGLLITFFSAVLAVPTQIIFHQLINPDFFQNMKEYAVQRAISLHEDADKARQAAEMYFNLGSYLTQSVFATLLGGGILSLLMAWYKTRRRS